MGGIGRSVSHPDTERIHSRMILIARAASSLLVPSGKFCRATSAFTSSLNRAIHCCIFARSPPVLRRHSQTVFPITSPGGVAQEEITMHPIQAMMRPRACVLFKIIILFQSIDSIYLSNEAVLNSFFSG